MKKEELFELIGETEGTIPEVKKSIPLWLKLTAAAACFAVTIAGIRIADSFNTVGGPATSGENAVITMESKGEKGVKKDLDAVKDDKTIYEGEKIITENTQATTEAETSDISVNWPDAEKAAKNSDVYAGCYLDKFQSLVILLTEDTPENREKVCEDMGVSMNNVTFKEAEYSKSYLDSIHEKVTEAMMESRFDTIVGSGVMEMENYVEVILTEEDAEAIAFLNGIDNTGAINIVYGAVSTTAELIEKK